VDSYSDVPDRFERLREVALATPGGMRMLDVGKVRRIAEGYLISFESIETPEAAALLVGGLLQIPEERLAPLPDGRYYECDLIGMEVRTDAGVRLGILKDVLTTRGNAVFVVEGSGIEHLIPATKEVVRSVDVEGRLMIVHPLPGLLDEAATDAV
jgi:16S rRNA processing protein RimM